MKAVILAGGLGTRISEETHLKPKPMIEIGGRPILWHVMKLYSAHGVNEFVICCGYKGYLIKEYFANYFLHMSDVTFDIAFNTMTVHERKAEPWKVTLVDTGESTMTGGRLKRVADHIRNEEAFCFTYGDGVGDVDITALIAFHRGHGKLATVTSVAPPGRYGALERDGAMVRLTQGGGIQCAVGLTDSGQGVATAMAQIAADAVGAAMADVRVFLGDTEHTPVSGGNWGSRGTGISGEALWQAGRALRLQLLEAAAAVHDCCMLPSGSPVKGS